MIHQRDWLILPALRTALLYSALALGVCAHAGNDSVRLPTGQWISPLAPRGASFSELNPGLADYPSFTVDGAVAVAPSPDGRTLLVLTSGFNQNGSDYYNPIAAASNQYVFVLDISGRKAVRRQVLQVPNTYAGIAFSPDGSRFYVSGGADDVVHSYALADGRWRETGTSPIALNHGGLANGVLQVGGQLVSNLGDALAYYAQGPLAAGVAVTADGRRLVVANHYNDSISVVNLRSRSVSAELDLRPGRNEGPVGKPGGEYPFGVQIAGNDTAFVSSVRDREVVVVRMDGDRPSIRARIALGGAPNRMLLDRAQQRLFVACDLSDTVEVIDVVTLQRIARVRTFGDDASRSVTARTSSYYRGASPDGLALSPDERTLYVTNRGTNSVAVIALDSTRSGGTLVGQIPTGWAPQDVAVSADGRRLFVVNARGPSGANPGNCYGLGDPGPSPGAAGCLAGSPISALVPNTYVLNLEKAGFQALPVPDAAELARLTDVVAHNNGLDREAGPTEAALMRALRERIRHVIYVVKENRTYDQVLGDLKRGNGDPSLTEFGAAVTPSQHALARNFVNLDNFMVAGEVSGNGWPWSMAARETDTGWKNVAMNYALTGRGGSYDWQGPNRYINTGLVGRQRLSANPATPPDPDLLPGHANVASPDGPGGEREQGYLWNAALRAGLSVRNYGFDVDETLYDTVAFGALAIPLDPEPARNGTVMGISSHVELNALTDPFYRGFDTAYPDFWRVREWEREFREYERHGRLPALSLVYLSSDHTGSFDIAISGVDTPERQVADNDYAVGRMVETVARSRYAGDTLFFIVEDDAQDGPDHVDAHRSTAYVVGPYVRQGVTVSTPYGTVNVLRTITDILGIDHLGLFDANQAPMSDVFDLGQSSWDFTAIASGYLAGTQLPIPRAAFASAGPLQPTHDRDWWVAQTRGVNFARHDAPDAAAYNRVLWDGLMGGRPYPAPVRAAARVAGAARDDDD